MEAVPTELTFLKPWLLSPEPETAGDSALIALHPSGRCLGFIADAPALPLNEPQDTASVILQLFSEAAGSMDLAADAEDGKASVAWLFNTINRQLQKLHPSYQACFLCFYRAAERIFVAAAGDVSLVLVWPDKLVRVTNPEPNEVYGQRTLDFVSPLPAKADRPQRIGQMAAYPAEAVVEFPAHDLRRVVLFSDGVEKHDPDFESRLEFPYRNPQEFQQVVLQEGRLPTRYADLKDDVCILLFDLPPVVNFAAAEHEVTEPEESAPESEPIETIVEKIARIESMLGSFEREFAALRVKVESLYKFQRWQLWLVLAIQVLWIALMMVRNFASGSRPAPATSTAVGAAVAAPQPAAGETPLQGPTKDDTTLSTAAGARPQ